MQQAEELVVKLSREDLARFRQWFLEFDNAVWDAQIEVDAAAGKLDPLAEEALSEYQSKRGAACQDPRLAALIANHSNAKPFSWEEWSKRPPIDFGGKYPGEFEDWLRDIRRGYREMAADEAHETQAIEWAEATIEDVAEEPEDDAKYAG